jgi:hypothetical protein
VLLHQWDQAMALAAAHAYPQAEQLLAKYAGHLLDKKRYMETVELYKKVGEGWGGGGCLQGFACRHVQGEEGVRQDEDTVLSGVGELGDGGIWHQV